MRVPVILDRRSAAPLQRQIYEQWRQRILRGALSPGARVPSTRELAEAIGVSRTTTTAAYEQLLAEGYLEAIHGAGTFVCRQLPDDLTVAAPATPAPAVVRSIRLSKFGARLRVPSPLPASDRQLDLSVDGPDLTHFPIALWRRLHNRQQRQAHRHIFGRADSAAGYTPLRHAIADYVGRSRAVAATADQVVIVNGSQQALDLTARLLIDSGDMVAVEHPGYAGARELFAVHGARIRLVPVTHEGLSVIDLPARPRLVYTTPSHQFPTGAAMTLARRLELIEWARGHDAVLIEDDYDSEFRYSGAPLPAMHSLSRDVPIVYVGTFSNVMFPGLRIGYVVVPPALAAAFVRAKWLADRQTALPDQAALALFIGEGHMERHIRRMRRIYRRRRDALVEALSRHFGTDATMRGDASGMHALVTFTGASIHRCAERAGVRVKKTDACYADGVTRNEIIVGFSALGERTIETGIRKLAAASGRA
jgi:GntR family transcriptional regulator/MocR family aminotransferase